MSEPGACAHGIVSKHVGNGCYTWCARCSMDVAHVKDSEEVERLRVRCEDAERALLKAAARVVELEETNVLLRNENVRLSNKGEK